MRTRSPLVGLAFLMSFSGCSCEYHASTRSYTSSGGERTAVDLERERWERERWERERAARDAEQARHRNPRWVSEPGSSRHATGLPPSVAPSSGPAVSPSTPPSVAPESSVAEQPPPAAFVPSSELPAPAPPPNDSYVPAQAPGDRPGSGTEGAGAPGAPTQGNQPGRLRPRGGTLAPR